MTLSTLTMTSVSLVSFWKTRTSAEVGDKSIPQICLVV